MVKFLVLLTVTAGYLFGQCASEQPNGYVTTTTSPNTLTWYSGQQFTTGASWNGHNLQVLIPPNGTNSQYPNSSVSSVTDATHMVAANGNLLVNSQPVPYWVDTCPTYSTSVAGSTTFVQQANTAYTSLSGISITGVDTLAGIIYDTASAACANNNTPLGTNCYDVFKPHGYTMAQCQILLTWHGGGGNSGNRQSALGGGDGTGPFYRTIYHFLDRGIPVAIINFDYRLANGSAANPFPAQAQDALCGVTSAMTQFGFTPSSLWYWGGSWGGLMAWWSGNVPAGTFGVTSTCVGTVTSTVPVLPAKSRTASLHTPSSLVLPTGVNNSSWYNFVNSGVSLQTAVIDQLVSGGVNCAVQVGPDTASQCRTFDVALASGGLEPYAIINSTNAAHQAANAQWWAWGPAGFSGNGDTLIEPYWIGNTTIGNAPYVSSQTAAIGLFDFQYFWPGTIHEGLLGYTGGGMQGDSYDFLANQAPVKAAGSGNLMGGGMM